LGSFTFAKIHKTVNIWCLRYCNVWVPCDISVDRWHMLEWGTNRRHSSWFALLCGRRNFIFWWRIL